MHIMIRKFFLWKMLTRAARAESTPDTLCYHLRRFNLCPIRIQEACGIPLQSANYYVPSFSCHCHAIAMLLPYYCHALAMLLLCYCHAIAMSTNI